MTPRLPRWALISRVDLAEAARVVADAVHLVDDDGDLPDAEQMQQIAVPARLLAHALGGVDDQQRGIGLRGAGDHVAQEFGVAGRVDQHEVARRRAEADLAGVDGDALVALGLQRVEQERPLERHAAPRADGLELLELAVGQAAGLVQQPADQGRLAVIDMADDDDAHQRARGLRSASDLGRRGRSWRNVHDATARSQIAGDAQALEGVLGLVVHGAAGALGRPGGVELGDDLVDRARPATATGEVMSASPSER